MKRIFTVIVFVFTALFVSASALQNLPRTIETGPWPAGHVQGIAVDTAAGHVYFSFTTLLVKTDMQGNVLGTVKGLLGHLGCLDFNEQDGCVYGSLEYKNDAIGKGILEREGAQSGIDNAFYIAIFDGERITRLDMDAEKDGVMTTVYLPTVLDDYMSVVRHGGKEKEHRYGCSGIDGVSFGPEFGKSGGRQFLVVAYGIYGDGERSDNDYQVLLQYDTSKWNKYATPLSQSHMHLNGPAKPRNTYFVYTGNTTYGVQNLEWDSASGDWFMSVYRGKKPQFPNYPLFIVDGRDKPSKQILRGVPYTADGKVLPLKDGGLRDAESGICGYDFSDGTTGMCSLGNGLFYISRNSSNKQGQSCRLTLYKFTGNGSNPFEVVK